MPKVGSGFIPGGLLPGGQRLARWLEHYSACNECGQLPTDADDIETGDLCQVGGELLEDLDYLHRTGLIQLGLAHRLVGAEEADRGKGE